MDQRAAPGSGSTVAAGTGPDLETVVAPASVEALLLDDIAQRQNLLAAINASLATAVALLFAPALPAPLVGGWIAAMLLVQAIRVIVWARISGGPETAAGARLVAITAGSAASGVLWGLFGLLFDVPDSVHLQVLRPFILAGMVAGSVISLPAHLPSFFAFFVPALSPYAIAMLTAGSAVERWMGAITMGFGVGITLVALQMHRMLARSVLLGQRNRALVASLEASHRLLEQRVQQRTLDLSRMNAALTREVDERRRSEARVRHLLQHDGLTQVANRALLQDRLAGDLARARREGGRLAVVMIDLVGFKAINDGHGHHAGDRVLVEVAARLKRETRASDTVARLGGDEFAVLLGRLAEPQDAAAVAAKLLDAIERPVRIDTTEIVPAATLGVSLYPEHGSDGETLLRRADMALYAARERGQPFLLFEPALEVTALARRDLERELARAIGQGELRLHFQPRFDLASGAMCGAEALVRWQHPERGLLPPSEFVPAAEASGLIREIGAWVVAVACAEASRWPAAAAPLSVSVNVSPAELRDEAVLAAVLAALAGSGLAARRLELELTESLFLAFAGEEARRVLAALREHGVRLAIDDFGTGYSSLAHLRQLPFDVVKIDRSFVAAIGRHAEDEAIVRAVVTLAHGLGRRVVGEGVETEAQLAFLRAIGCDEAQGFLLGRPMPANELLRRVA
jgi:diguanylate cyclase (GGDEF)-like protein